MKILALEFSSAQRSVAVVNAPEGRAAASDVRSPTSGLALKPGNVPVFATTGSVISEVIETGPGGTRALAMVQEALREAKLEREQIECLAVGLGPGSYTGIRAAIALAQGWQIARGVKLIGISSAECLAAQAQSEGLTGKVTVMIDAQRGEFYLAGYEIRAEGYREFAPLRIATPAEARDRERAGEVLIGPEATRGVKGRILFPRAATIGRLASGRSDFVAGEKLEPVYLRETAFVKAPPPRMIS